MSLVFDSLEGHSLLSPYGRFLFRYRVGIAALRLGCRQVDSALWKSTQRSETRDQDDPDLPGRSSPVSNRLSLNYHFVINFSRSARGLDAMYLHRIRSTSAMRSALLIAAPV